MSIILKFLESWSNAEGNVSTNEELLDWIEKLNVTTYVDIKECSIKDSKFWYYDNYVGAIMNKKQSFFSISGVRYFLDDAISFEQPMIIQPEIGFLGIICKEINGVLNFLMQAKIEPGNVNCVQISPTIQATKSNFTRAHGGKKPEYLEYFNNSEKYTVIVDQLQSEQGTRFYKKRNRNMIVFISEDIKISPNYKWMTLGQIKKLMQIDNLVNMDTRTVLANIPFTTTRFTGKDLGYIESLCDDKSFFESAFKTNPADNLSDLYKFINDYKMFHNVKVKKVPLHHLTDWIIDDYGIESKNNANFSVKYYDIAISGREVQRWTQPLFKATGQAIIGLITCKIEGVTKYLVNLSPEIGAFDMIEIGPSIHFEASHASYADNSIQVIFRTNLENNRGIILDVILSEEGGRFYHEQNRNVIMEVSTNELKNLPKGYFLVNYSTLNYLIQVNNCLNIELRNLLALLKI